MISQIKATKTDNTVVHVFFSEKIS